MEYNSLGVRVYDKDITFGIAISIAHFSIFNKNHSFFFFNEIANQKQHSIVNFAYIYIGRKEILIPILNCVKLEPSVSKVKFLECY